MYVAIEGVSFSGKSTQIKRFIRTHSDWLACREPGGTPLGIKLERMIKNTDMSNLTRELLLLADRSHHIDRIVAPALCKDRSVISDRSLLSGIAYMIGVMQETGLTEEKIIAIQRSIVNNHIPDKIIILEHTSLSNMIEREPALLEMDLIEKKGPTYLMGIQEIMIEQASQLTKDVLRVDASLPADTIQYIIDNFVGGAS